MLSICLMEVLGDFYPNNKGIFPVLYAITEVPKGLEGGKKYGFCLEIVKTLYDEI